MAEGGDEGKMLEDEPKSPPPISRLNSLTGRVSEVTDKTRKLMSNIRERQSSSSKGSSANQVPPPTIAKSLDGVMIDRRLTEPSGVLYKAKMIGSLSVAYHKGDKMAVDAMRNLKVMAKTSGRHKDRIMIRISIQGLHILETETLRQIHIHDLDKISYLAEDPDDKKVFSYIYNKRILNKETGKSTNVHRLFAIKTPKCSLVVSNMKAVFHYMHDMRMGFSDPNAVDMKAAREAVIAERRDEEEAAVVEEASAPPAEKNEDADDPLGFGYAQLVDIIDTENLIQPVVPEDPTLFPSDEGTPAAAVNLYVTGPTGNRLSVPEEEEDEEEPVYSTVRKFRNDAGEAGRGLVRQKATEKDPLGEMGTVNPAWMTQTSEANSIDEDDPWSLDKYNRPVSSSSDESEEEHTFGVNPTPAPATIPSAVFVDPNEYEWDIGEPRLKAYSEDHVEMSQSRERLSTVTKKAVASLEKTRVERQQSGTGGGAPNSLIDFCTFEDRLESSTAVDLFDSLSTKPAPATTQATAQASSGLCDELLSLDLTPAPAAPQGAVPVVVPSSESRRYEVDISSLLGSTTPSVPAPAKPPVTAASPWFGNGFGAPSGPSQPGFGATTTQGQPFAQLIQPAPQASGGFGAFSQPTQPQGGAFSQPAQPQGGAFSQPAQPQGGAFGGAAFNTGPQQPNYQPNFGFPVNFGEQTKPAQPKSTNPFHQPAASKTTSAFDPFSDLMGDAI